MNWLKEKIKRNKIFIVLLILLIGTFFGYGIIRNETMLKTCNAKGFPETIFSKDAAYCKNGEKVLGIGCGGEIWNIKCNTAKETQLLKEI